MRAIIPAGGAGTRLWPLSRRNRPKFLLDLAGSGQSLLADAIGRLRGAKSVMVVTGLMHEDAVRAQVGRSVEVITELSPRDSMAAIGLAAAIVEVRYGREEVVGSFAADHVVADNTEFARAVRSAEEAAEAGWICTIGIGPRFAATGFGYIAPGDSTESGDTLQVKRFVEKPDQETASRYVREGYLWNAGMFVAKAGLLLDTLSLNHPHLASGLRQIAGAWDSPDRDDVRERVWPGLTKIAIDHAVAEPAAALGKVAVAPTAPTLGWDDVGDFGALAKMDNILQVGQARAEVIASGSTLVATDLDSTELIAVLGIEDAVIVRTKDATLVASPQKAQEIKQLTASLPAEYR